MKHLHTILRLLTVTFIFCRATSTPSRPNNKPLPQIIGQEFAYKRWRTILERSIRMPNGRVVDFDLVGMAGASSAVVVFAWNTSQKTATLVREYHPGAPGKTTFRSVDIIAILMLVFPFVIGPHKFLFGAAAGIVEDDKHNANVELAAQQELEEECHLAGGTWHLLTPEPLAMDKYSTTNIRAFLVLDASHVPDPRPQDHEEDIEIIRNVSLDEIRNMIRRGEMNIVGTWACLMAIEKLRDLGEIE